MMMVMVMVVVVVVVMVMVINEMMVVGRPWVRSDRRGYGDDGGYGDGDI